MKAGIQSEKTTLMLSDTQIIDEQMLEDISNIVNSGHVPGIYGDEDLEKIYAIGKIECQRRNLPVNNANMF